MSSGRYQTKESDSAAAENKHEKTYDPIEAAQAKFNDELTAACKEIDNLLDNYIKTHKKSLKQFSTTPEVIVAEKLRNTIKEHITTFAKTEAERGASEIDIENFIKKNIAPLLEQSKKNTQIEADKKSTKAAIESKDIPYYDADYKLRTTLAGCIGHCNKLLTSNKDTFRLDV